MELSRFTTKSREAHAQQDALRREHPAVAAPLIKGAISDPEGSPSGSSTELAEILRAC